MRKSLLRALTLAGVLGAMIWLSVGSASAAVPPPPRPVGPNQFFDGSVNGVTSTVVPPRPAVVKMFCPGPIFPGRKGHPVPGQPVLVTQLFPPVPFPTLGFTGSAATSIVATFNDDRSVPLRFTRYSVSQPIPTALLLPCFGTGQVTFKPTPFGLRARSFVLPVQYLDIVP